MVVECFVLCASTTWKLVRCSAVEAELIRLEVFSKSLRSAMEHSQVRGRLFSHFKDAEVNEWMTPQDRESVIASVEQTFSELDAFGIRISDLDPASSSDVVWLARGIMTLVYMDAMDSMVFASALVASATHLVTTDGPFKAVVNGFKNLDSEGAETRSKRLSSLVKTCTGLELASKEFPITQDIKKLRPWSVHKR